MMLCQDNWAQSEEKMREYARNIRADEAIVIEAFREVPSMPLAQFKKIAQALFTLANQLSTTAYQNVQQARFIAERQRAEEALPESERTTRANEQRLLMAQVIGRTGAWELDLVTNTLWGSAEAYRIFGLPSVAREFPVDELESFVPDRTRVHQALVDLVTLGTAYDLEYAINPADGSAPRVVHSMARLERDALGKPVKVMGVIRDITEGKRIEQERTKLETQLQRAQKLESVGRLAGGVARDFNNMLQIILGNAQLALAEIPPDAPARTNLEEIQNCALTIRYAGAHYAREDWLAARDFLSLAAEIDPNYPRLLGSLGSLQFQLQEYPAACTTFSAAVRQNANDPDLHIQLAMVQLKLDHPEAAEASLNSALGLRPNDLTALKLLADSKRDHGRYLEAGAIYGKLINQHPDQVGVFLSLAKCFYKVGDREGTQAALQFVLTLDPANEIARENLATLQA
jgi:tetratricopeptide (TPR) repeat protein